MSEYDIQIVPVEACHKSLAQGCQHPMPSLKAEKVTVRIAAGRFNSIAIEIAIEIGIGFDRDTDPDFDTDTNTDFDRLLMKPLGLVAKLTCPHPSVMAAPHKQV